MSYSDALKYEKMGDGKFYYIIEGPSLEGNNTYVSYALSTETLKEYGGRRQFTMLQQCEKMVIPGLVLTKHIFQGLNRNLCCDDDMKGDSNKFVFSRKPAYDYGWANKKPFRDFSPPDKVFVVVISKNMKHSEKFPSIAGWIERWHWIDEDPDLLEAPIGWVDRFNKKIWSKK